MLENGRVELGGSYGTRTIPGQFERAHEQQHTAAIQRIGRHQSSTPVDSVGDHSRVESLNRERLERAVVRRRQWPEQ